MNKDYENDSKWINWDNTVDMPPDEPATQDAEKQAPQQPQKTYPMPDPYARDIPGSQLHPMAEYDNYYSPANSYANPQQPVQQNGVYPGQENPTQQHQSETYPQQKQPEEQNPFEEYARQEQPVQQNAYPQQEQAPLQYPYGINRPQDEADYQNPFDVYAQQEQTADRKHTGEYTQEEVTVPFDEPQQPAPQPETNPVQPNPSEVYPKAEKPFPPEYAQPAQPTADEIPAQAVPDEANFSQHNEEGNPVQPPVQPDPAQPGNDFRQPYGEPVQHLSKAEIKARRKALKKQKKAEKGKKGKIIGFSILAVILAIFIAGYFVLFHDPNADAVKSGSTTEAPSATVTDANGYTYAAVVDTNGVTYAAVPDSEGHLWQVNINADGSFGDVVGSLDGVLNTTTAAASTINETANTANYTGQAQDVSTTTASADTGTTTAAGKTTSADNSSDTKDTTSADTTASTGTEFNLIRYQQMFASGTYYMEFTTNDEDLGDGTIVSAAKNGNIYFNTSLEGITASILYLAENDKSYIVIDDMKSYCSLPKKLLGEDVDMKDMNIANSMFSEKMTEDVLSSKEVELNGQTLTCEYCETTSGTLYEYYFDNGTLVRCDITSSDGSVEEMYFSKITTEVDDSVFTIPDSYKYINLSWLG